MPVGEKYLILMKPVAALDFTTLLDISTSQKNRFFLLLEAVNNISGFSCDSFKSVPSAFDTSDRRMEFDAWFWEEKRNRIEKLMIHLAYQQFFLHNLKDMMITGTNQIKKEFMFVLLLFI